MYLFYETLPEPVTGNTSSVISIDSCVFRNGVDISEESSGLSIYFYYPVDISTTVFSCSRAVQYHAILHSTGVIARESLYSPMLKYGSYRSRDLKLRHRERA